MGVWDTSTPAGTDAISGGDDRIREMKTAIQEALRGGATDGDEAIFPGSAPTTAPVFHYRGLKGATGARPTAGEYGLYINTTLNTIQRDNGASWDDVATLIPSGTKMLFYQASAPTGWTADSVDNLFLRVVNAGGTGGTSGGSGLQPDDTITLAHTHTIPQACIDYTSGPAAGSGTAICSADSDGAALQTITGGASTVRSMLNRLKSGYSSGSSLSDIAFQYADVIVATKD